MARILLAEDELIVGWDIRDTLEEHGFEVDGPHATSVEGLDAASARLPDVAFLDARLADGPVKPLSDFLHGKGIPMVFHSGHAQPEDFIGSYPQSVICPKPSTQEQYVAAVRQLLAAG